MKKTLSLLILVFALSCSTQEGILEPETLGQIQIKESNKHNAKVFLNNQFVGSLVEGSLTLDSIANGKYSVALFQSGYEVFEKETLVQEGQSVDLNFTLIASSSGNLQVQGELGSLIFINSYQFGSIDSSGIFLVNGLATGQHSLIIQNGNQNQETPIQISKDLTTFISSELSLKPKVLIEHVSNVGCVSCPSHSAVLHKLLDSLEWKGISKISYHANWPFKEDPLYLFDPEPQKERALFYGAKVNYAVPIFVVNGRVLEFEADNVKLHQELSSAIEFELQKKPLFNIQVSLNQVWVSSLDSVKFEGSLQLNLIQNQMHFANAPGINQETEFFQIHKRQLINQSLQLSANSSQNIPFHLKLQDLNPQELSLVAFIQNTQGQVLQSTTLALNSLLQLEVKHD